MPVTVAVLRLATKAEELAGDRNRGRSPGGDPQGGFGGSAEGWLTLLRGVSQPTQR